MDTMELIEQMTMCLDCLPDVTQGPITYGKQNTVNTTCDLFKPTFL